MIRRLLGRLFGHDWQIVGHTLSGKWRCDRCRAYFEYRHR